MSTPKIALLRQALAGIQAHAAGMHANADMALRLLAEMHEETAREALTQMTGGMTAGSTLHYGDEVETLFRARERSGGSPPNPATGGDTSAQEH